MRDFFIYLFIYYGMATENCQDVVTYLAVRPPQASKKLSPPHRSPDPPRRGPPLPLPRPHHHCLLVRATGTTGADSMAETVDGPAPGGGRRWRRHNA